MEFQTGVTGGQRNQSTASGEHLCKLGNMLYKRLNAINTAIQFTYENVPNFENKFYEV